MQIDTLLIENIQRKLVSLERALLDLADLKRDFALLQNDVGYSSDGDDLFDGKLTTPLAGSGILHTPLGASALTGRWSSVLDNYERSYSTQIISLATDHTNHFFSVPEVSVRTSTKVRGQKIEAIRLLRSHPKGLGRSDLRNRLAKKMKREITLSQVDSVLQYLRATEGLIRTNDGLYRFKK